MTPNQNPIFFSRIDESNKPVFTPLRRSVETRMREKIPTEKPFEKTKRSTPKRRRVKTSKTQPYKSKKEQTVVVECKGHDAARINNVEHAHGWEEDVIGLVEQKHRKKKVSVSFECETLKADKAAEDHIRQFMPKLSGLDAVINIGPMKISGLDFAVVEEEHAN
ncbi:unnamed protein product [Brassica napus]|uniref:(rape) hypothetical protein n=1 Tax=Brassica napus TaxID=3708 RepID=A0A816N4V1_BRANA|nr:unnamed protein product [Brassica napus]